MSESVFTFQARADQHFRRKLATKDAELARAKRALRLEAAKLKEQRQRSADALRALEEIREMYRGKGASAAAYVAILALHRVQSALGHRP